jgi:hypothetical protein
MRCTMSAAGEPNWRSGRTSASARSASSPAWQSAIPHSFVPDPSRACRKAARVQEGGLGGKLVR